MGHTAGEPRKVRGYAEVSHETGSQLLEQVLAQHAKVSARLETIGAVIAIASGKGGVGKSAVTANLAVSLTRRGARVGVVDADLNGPSLGRMLGLLGSRLVDGPDGVVPPAGAAGVLGISTELLLKEDAPLRWKGPDSDRVVWLGLTEAAVLREFLSDVVWGELDYLLIDIPPGTDKIGRFLDLVPNPASVLVVTIPSEVALSVVSRSVAMLQEAGVESIGVVGNMSGYASPGAVRPLPLFSGDGIRRLTESTGLELWAEIPFDPGMGARTDGGDPPGASDDSLFGKAFQALADRVERGVGGREAAS
ncbi:MAG: P-loop NTPase [Gemmatimonadetes bacterium]|nr:P-loop NTPase [Gemmatimonadota bacterium]